MPCGGLIGPSAATLDGLLLPLLVELTNPGGSWSGLLCSTDVLASCLLDLGL